jgi:hypothetical protein
MTASPVATLAGFPTITPGRSCGDDEWHDHLRFDGQLTE